jgi:hypothetical protein
MLQEALTIKIVFGKFKRDIDWRKSRKEKPKNQVVSTIVVKECHKIKQD